MPVLGPVANKMFFHVCSIFEVSKKEGKEKEGRGRERGGGRKGRYC